MTDVILTIVTIAAGCLVCFAGYRFFRLSLALVGAALGFVAGVLLVRYLVSTGIEIPELASVIIYAVFAIGFGVGAFALYMKALNHPWNEPNIFLTLFLGLCALWGIREKKFLSQIWAPAAALILATMLHADYKWKGVLLFIMLYAVQDSRPGIAAVMVSYFLFWGSAYGVTKTLFGIRLNLNSLPAFLSQPLSAFMRLETYGLLSLPLILIPFRRDLKIPRWVGYILYPAHLLLLIALEAIFK